MKEEEIRPKELMRAFLDSSRRDAENMASDEFVTIPCPGCGGGASERRFEKIGFRYVLCRDCGSLYCSPRPDEEALAKFYRESESSRYWAKTFFPAVAEIRREKLFREKAARIRRRLEEKKFEPNSICDVGAGYGVFLEELGVRFPDAELCAVEPGLDAAELCRERGFETLGTTAEESAAWSDRFDLVISSEVIEHVFSISNFVSSLANLVKPGGYCLVTGLGYEGYDILRLQERSDSVFPPHHLNFLSLRGFETSFAKNGFSSVYVETPGKLDADIVSSSGLGDEFARVLELRGAEAKADFQTFLQKHSLSSHVWVWARK